MRHMERSSDRSFLLDFSIIQKFKKGCFSRNQGRNGTLQSCFYGVGCGLQLSRKEGRGIAYLIPLIATASMAVVTDYRDWRIPNQLIAFGMIQGFMASAVMSGMYQGLVNSVRGCVIPLVVLYVLFLIRALGAGDIKLLAVAGTFVGTDILRVMAYSFLAGGVISAGYLLKEHLLSITSRKKKSDRRTVHFSVAVLLGVVCYVLETT